MPRAVAPPRCAFTYCAATNCQHGKNRMALPRFERPKSLKDAYERFLKIHGHPREIALGFALGLFVGMTPFMGFQMLIAVFFATLFKANKISAAAAVWISNPLTAPVLYSITYLTGAKICGFSKINTPPPYLDTSTLWALLQRTPHVLTMMIVGGVVLGLPLAIAGFFFSYQAVSKYQLEIKQKLRRKKHKKKT